MSAETWEFLPVEVRKILGGADRYISRIIIQPVARMDVGGES